MHRGISRLPFSVMLHCDGMEIWDAFLSSDEVRQTHDYMAQTHISWSSLTNAIVAKRERERNRKVQMNSTWRCTRAHAWNLVRPCNAKTIDGDSLLSRFVCSSGNSSVWQSKIEWIESDSNQNIWTTLVCSFRYFYGFNLWAMSKHQWR